MRTIVLDSGAFIAAERRDRKLRTHLTAADLEDAAVVIPTAVIAEVWRTPTRPFARELRSYGTDLPLDAGVAERVGTLLGDTQSTQVVDGTVAVVAARYIPSLVLTSDPTDIELLLTALGISCAIGSASTVRTDVIIEGL